MVGISRKELGINGKIQDSDKVSTIKGNYAKETTMFLMLMLTEFV